MSLKVGIVGLPNVGKSTLLNQLLKEKIAIVSDKPQTTRHRIHGVLTRDGSQFVFVDTPGIHKPRTLLGERFLGEALEVVAQARTQRVRPEVRLVRLGEFQGVVEEGHAPLAQLAQADPQRFLERTAKIQWGIMVCVYGMSHAPALLLLEFAAFHYDIATRRHRIGFPNHAADVRERHAPLAA